MVRRSAEEIAQIERLQRRGKRHHDLQNKPNGDQLLEAASHESLEGPEYKLGTEAALAVATQRIVKFARVMFVFYGTLSCVGTTWLHDIHVVHTWSHDKNALSASVENLEFATQPLRVTHLSHRNVRFTDRGSFLSEPAKWSTLAARVSGGVTARKSRSAPSRHSSCIRVCDLCPDASLS